MHKNRRQNGSESAVETPISPHDREEVVNEPPTRYKHDLIRLAKNIRTTRSQLETELSKLNIGTNQDLLSITISEHRIMVHHPEKMPAVRRAKTAQNNLKSLYQRWNNIYSKHMEESNQET